MSLRPGSTPASWTGLVLAAVVALASLAAVGGLAQRNPLVAAAADGPDPFDGGVDWINTAPIKFKDLKGKIVILDFWTYCCINCHHVIPTLTKIEEKYKNEVVVVGVHTPKFNAERDTENVRRKVREYGVKHPVVSDADQVIWNRFGVNSWPTLIVVGPKGEPLAKQSGEVSFEALDHFVAETIKEHKADIDTTPVKFFPEVEKPDNTPLLFPGKVVADVPGKRLFISDTGHSRLVIAGLDGKAPTVVGDGVPGLADGPFEKARFNRPQGTVLVGETLYVADTENHAIRAVDLQSRTVTTVAGNGRQMERTARGHVASVAKTAELSSPWDLAHVGENSKVLYIAMAGPHQIWRLDLAAGKVGPWAGNGAENIVDGPLESAEFAQPSGLATDGTHLYVADSEVSAVRSIALLPGKLAVHSVVGEGLFEFGDVDGRGAAVRLQHCLGLAYGDGKLYIADTYNNKVKVCDPKARTVKTLVGNGERGDSADPARLYQPGGLSLAGETLYIADTNNHQVRVADLKTGAVTSLTVEGLTPPSPPRRKPVFVNATALTAPKATVAPGRSLTLKVTVPIPKGFKLNAEGSMPVLVETPGKQGVLASSEATGTKIEPPSKTFSLNVPLSGPVDGGAAFDLKVSVGAFVCSEGSNLCTVKSYVWNVPVEVSDGGAEKIDLGPASE